MNWLTLFLLLSFLPTLPFNPPLTHPSSPTLNLFTLPPIIPSCPPSPGSVVLSPLSSAPQLSPNKMHWEEVPPPFLYNCTSFLTIAAAPLRQNSKEPGLRITIPLMLLEGVTAEQTPFVSMSFNHHSRCSSCDSSASASSTFDSGSGESSVSEVD